MVITGDEMKYVQLFGIMVLYSVLCVFAIFVFFFRTAYYLCRMAFGMPPKTLSEEKFWTWYVLFFRKEVVLDVPDESGQNRHHKMKLHPCGHFVERRPEAHE